MSTITAITPTGDRPLAFELCKRWMFSQTHPPDQWIIADDGKTAASTAGLDNFTIDYIRREPGPGDPFPTISANLRAAIPHVIGDHVIIIEDDDYYAPTYIEEISRRLKDHEFVGLCHSKNYHLASGGYWVLANSTHASLAQTAFRSSFLQEFAELLPANHKYVDIEVWNKSREPKHIVNAPLLFVDSDVSLYCGIKGLPGRAGVVGHQDTAYQIFDNPNRDVLREWIPNDYQVYLDIISQWKA